MNWIEEMIAEQCPNGVKKMPLGGLITRSREKAKECKADVYAVTNNRGFVKSDSLHEFSIYSADTSNYSIVRKNHIAYNPSRLNIGSIALFNDEVGLISPMYVVFNYDTSVLSPKFLFLFLKSDYVSFLVDSKKEVGARFRFDFNKWNDIYIPLPPLSIQKEIVNVLDKFSELIEKTDEEIALRQKQYEYYREKLLTFEDGEVEWKKLGDVSNILTGGELKKDIFVSAEKNGEYIYPVYGNGKDVYGYINTYRVKNDSVCISSIGANTGAIFYHKGMFTPIIRLKVIELLDDSIVAKYIYYFLSTLKISSKNGGGIPNINANDVKMLQIPLPSPSRQQEIVATLDKFEALISKLKEERELRQKQYEYYREKLLTF